MTYIASSVLILLIAIQFIRPSKNDSASISESSLSSLYEVPDSINQLLERACFDCHSNHTTYPWYSAVEPLGWILDHHIRKGKEDLNFDEFGHYSDRMRRNKLKAVASQIRDGEMPIQSYTWLHPDARLNEREKQMLINWFTK